jgi:DNA gyrase subunit A
MIYFSGPRASHPPSQREDGAASFWLTRGCVDQPPHPSLTENGYGKRTAADEYRLTNRGGKGVINVKTTERNGKVVGIPQVTEDAEVMLISQYGKIIRIESKFIRESGRSAQGVRLLNIEAGDRVAAAVVIPPEEEPTNGGTLIQ